jgi:salicylate hydroxylase
MQVTEKVQKQLGIDDAWLLVHRVDLHNALREKAEEGTEGRKPKIHLSCPVDSVVSYHYLRGRLRKFH